MPLRTTLIGVVLAATALIPLQGTALASPNNAAPSATSRSAASQSAAPPASSVAGIEDATARALAASLDDTAWNRQVRSAALAGDSVDLRALTSGSTTATGKQLAPRVATADRDVAAAKGLGADIGSLLRLGEEARAAAEVHVHLDARGRTVSQRTAASRQS